MQLSHFRQKQSRQKLTYLSHHCEGQGDESPDHRRHFKARSSNHFYFKSLLVKGLSPPREIIPSCNPSFMCRGTSPPSVFLFIPMSSHANNYCKDIILFLDVEPQTLWGRKASTPCVFSGLPMSIGNTRFCSSQVIREAKGWHGFHQEAALAPAGVVKEHGKGGELSKFLSVCLAWHRTSEHCWFRGFAFLSKKAQSN